MGRKVILITSDGEVKNSMWNAMLKYIRNIVLIYFSNAKIEEYEEDD